MIAVAALAAAAASVRLDPVLDRPYRLVTTQERSVSGRVHHFSAERRLVFHRDGDGLVAELTLVALSQDIGGQAGRRFEAGAGALRGRPVCFHLDPAGRLLAIEDETAVWATITAGLHPAGERHGSAAPQAAMTALAPEARRATIASMLLPLLAGEAGDLVPGVRAVAVPSRLIATGEPLAGTETVALGADALLHVATHADRTGGDTAVSLDRERTIDPARGLVVSQRETQTVRLGQAVQVTRETTLLTLR